MAPVPPAAGSAAIDCGATTLNGTMVDTNDDGVLECGPGQPLILREDLAKALAGREARRVPLSAFFSLADFQYVDEESPLRGEWADKCEDHLARSAFRPHETMVGHMMNAHVRTASQIAAQGSPILGQPFDFTLALGDLADNQQYNETRFVIDAMDGGKLVDPDTGADGYDGVQGTDPEGGTPALTTPVPGESILDLANEPFWASGLRNADGTPIPWYSLLGNHDMKVQGTIADDNAVWRAFVRQWAVGSLKVMDIAPDKQQEACAGGFTDPDFWMSLLTSPGTTEVVPADPDRRLVDRADWIAEHAITTGLPVGHGFLPAVRRCPATSYPAYAPRACYSWDERLFRYIALDTNAAEGLDGGNLDDAQFQWLEEELKRVSRVYYQPDGKKVINPQASNRLVVVAAHHTIATTDNTGPRTGQPPGSVGPIHTGEDLTQLLLRFPNVILQVDGHTHENRILAHQNPILETAFWEVNTSAIADYPTQSRTIEIADNGDGTLSIFAVVFDASAAPNPRDIDWAAHDHTHETALAGAPRDINEDWLASAGREVQLHDPQQDLMALGTPGDRNVELVIGRPFELPSPGAIEACLRRGRPGLNQVLGTPGRDTIRGTKGPDILCGFDGRDMIRALKGNDVAVAGTGRDRASGGPGRDRLLGQGGRDVLRGGSGKDRLLGGGGRDVCVGGPGRDRQRSCVRR